MAPQRSSAARARLSVDADAACDCSHRETPREGFSCCVQQKSRRNHGRTPPRPPWDSLPVDLACGPPGRSTCSCFEWPSPHSSAGIFEGRVSPLEANPGRSVHRSLKAPHRLAQSRYRVSDQRSGPNMPARESVSATSMHEAAMVSSAPPARTHTSRGDRPDSHSDWKHHIEHDTPPEHPSRLHRSTARRYHSSSRFLVPGPYPCDGRACAPGNRLHAMHLYSPHLQSFARLAHDRPSPRRGRHAGQSLPPLPAAIPVPPDDW